jgi:hypothetical protein
MSSARSVLASFNVPILTVTRAGTTLGTVASSPAGISCGSDCSEVYAFGTTVTLTATPAVGGVFTGWSGCTSSTGTTCTVSANVYGTRGVTANFATAPTQTTHPLTVSLNGSGRVTSSPAGIDCGADCIENIVEGSTVTLTATPATGQRFVGWSGACTGTSNSCTVTVSTATSVQASFEALPALPAMSVGALAGSRTIGTRSWSASATVTMHTATGTPVAGATVTVNTTGAAASTLTCVTAADGRCSVRRDNLKSSRTSITFTGSNATASTHTYDATRNVTSAVTVTR